MPSCMGPSDPPSGKRRSRFHLSLSIWLCPSSTMALAQALWSFTNMGRPPHSGREGHYRHMCSHFDGASGQHHIHSILARPIPRGHMRQGPVLAPLLRDSLSMYQHVTVADTLPHKRWIYYIKGALIVPVSRTSSDYVMVWIQSLSMIHRTSLFGNGLPLVNYRLQALFCCILSVRKDSSQLQFTYSQHRC